MLMLWRHAKAVPHGRGEDFDRDLADKGRADAARLARHLVDENLLPDLAWVSPAARSLETFRALQAATSVAIPVRLDRDLYHATAGDMRGALRGIDAGVSRLMIVGHNPGIADLAVMLARGGALAEIEAMNRRFPPCAIAVLSIETATWTDMRKSDCRLDMFVVPEDLVAPD